ncbi:KRAB [Mytilus edulis]|uniref:KRAB n=1 Tax=Mytilus edulis TaxID=6550 RepID=A0A8S3S7S4_MYTED|nr:KRAB [Mytilus edulis]
MECDMYDGKGPSVPGLTVPGKMQSVDSMLIIKQEVVDNAIESTVNENYENLQELINDPTTVSNSRDRNPDDAKNILLDEIKQEPCSPENEGKNNLYNGYIEEWTYLDKTTGNAEDNKSNKLKDRTDGVTDQIPYQDETDQEEPVMYIFNAENDMSELNDANENVNTGEVQNRRKRKGTKPKKIRQNVEKIEDLKYTCTTCDQSDEKVKEYKCPICEKEFGYRRNYRNHVKTHSTGKQFECTTCGKSFHLKHHLRHHMTKHMVEKPYKCTICDKRFSNYSMWYCHFKTHNTKGDYKFQCSICTKFFLTGAHLKFHLKTHKNGNSKTSENNQLKSKSAVDVQSEDYICTLCNDTFQDKMSLRQHEIFVHEEELNGNISPVGSDNFNIVGTKDDDLSGQSTDMELTENKIHIDQSVLDKSLPVKQSTVDLNLINDKNMDALLIQNALEESLNNSSESTGGQSLEKECSKFSEHDDSFLDFSACSESLKTASDIESKSENKQKRFDCSECSKSFSRKDSLNTHFRLHTGQNIHECNLCGKIFPKRSNYIRHMESCGKRERRVTQNEVLNENSFSKDFTPIEQLDASENAHCDNMIHVNDKNMDALLIQNALEESLNNSSESTEGQLSIEKESSKLSEHDDSYLDFSTCSDSLKTASDIESKSENKQKRFDCSECSKSFSRRDSLTTHFRLHTRQNIHECNLCGKIFPKRSNYIRHMESCGKRERRVTKNEKSNSEDFTAIEQFDTSQNAQCDKPTEICVPLEKHVWTHDQESFDEMKYKDGSEDSPVRKRLPKIQFKSSELKESANDSLVCEMTPTETDEYSTEEPFDNTYMVQVKIEPEELE